MMRIPYKFLRCRACQRLIVVDALNPMGQCIDVCRIQNKENSGVGPWAFASNS